MKGWNYLAVGIVATAVGTLIAFGIVALIAKKKYDEAAEQNPLLSLLAR